MNSALQDKLDRAPTVPGVYLMKDDLDTVIYVGKAGNLKKRLGSYFRNANQWNLKTNILVQKVSTFDTIVTRTEKEALILESNLIKKHRPRYNVLLKDDKRYPSLRLNPADEYPNLTIVRKPVKDGAIYFGPYASAQAVRETLNIVNKTFKLRKCKTREFKKRTRPCLHCQMQRCLAPCCTDVDPFIYENMIKEAILFLKGRTPDLIREIKHEMMGAAESHDFEKAARLRDRMFALEKTIEKQVAVTTDFKDRDVLAMARTQAFSLVTLFMVRGGYLMGTRHYPISETLAGDDEIIGSFIRQYYEKAHFVPRQILVPIPIEDQTLLEEQLTESSGRSVSIIRPERGEKAHLVAMAVRNAEKELADRIAAINAGEKMLSRLKARLKMQQMPHRIECIDISNLQGAEPVAAMVVFEKGKPKKSLYRKYRIRTVQAPDDYAAMAEVLRRRFGKGKASEPFPELLMVDGGKGQLNIAVNVLCELHLNGRFDVIGIAKKDEKRGETEDKIYGPGRVNAINFGRNGELLLFLQRIRDEAHRVAVTFHRQRRNKRTLHSSLDTIPGVGKKRKTLLLKHFGSIKNIRAATFDELNALPGITHSVAASVKSYLK
jgi:excinuclease ABC subunit C